MAGNDIMIMVKFTGGLGNQLYQYCMLRTLQERFSYECVKADIFSYSLYDAHYGFELDKIFHLKEKGRIRFASTGDFIFRYGELPLLIGGSIGKKLEVLIAWINCRTRRVFLRKKRRDIIERPGVSTDALLEQLNGMEKGLNWYLDGYWQSEIYFEESLGKIREELQFPEIEDLQNKKWKRLMEETESVSIHLRRGDYVNSEFDVIGMDYYTKAVTEMKKNVNNPVFFIFSDDTEYAKKKFEWLENKYIISNNKGMNSYIDLQLMSLCKNNIIANSSFSTWAGYLNGNEKKLVLYPSQYTKNEEMTERKEKGWKKIVVS